MKVKYTIEISSEIDTLWKDCLTKPMPPDKMIVVLDVLRRSMKEVKTRKSKAPVTK